MPDFGNAFDPMATTIDFLDACRARALDNVIGFYMHDAVHECRCNRSIYGGIGAIRDHWKSKLADMAPTLFQLEQIDPRPNGAAVTYRGKDDELIDLIVEFEGSGKIAYSHCFPAK